MVVAAYPNLFGTHGYVIVVLPVGVYFYVSDCAEMYFTIEVVSVA